MKEKLEKVMGTAKGVVKNVMIYVIVISAVIASFIVGFTYHKLTTKTVAPKTEMEKVTKSDVTIAIDESRHLIIINNNTGDYTVYQDSIGETIFKLYAANVWNQHSPVVNAIKTKP
jgi:hypothetical protein